MDAAQRVGRLSSAGSRRQDGFATDGGSSPDAGVSVCSRSMGSRQRLFVGVELSEGARIALGPLLESMRAGVRHGELRLITPERWHLTLQFLGSVEPERVPEILDACALTAQTSVAFEILFAGVGVFRSARAATVVWIGVEAGGDELGALAERLMAHTERLGFERERRAYRAHLTIARSKQPRDLSALLASAKVSPTAMTVDALTLFRSHSDAAGSRYEALGRLALGAVL
jgi:RNA 2',3'-cyclic 3'-phosphodiesterase